MRVRQHFTCFNTIEAHRASVAAGGRLNEIEWVPDSPSQIDKFGEAADLDGTRQRLINRLRKSNWATWAIQKITGDRIGGGGTAASPSQKLPSTAICCHFAAAKPLPPTQPFHFLFCPSRCVPAAWVAGSSTASRGWSKVGPAAPRNSRQFCCASCSSSSSERFRFIGVAHGGRANNSTAYMNPQTFGGWDSNSWSSITTVRL